jgi:hypothetical protein
MLRARQSSLLVQVRHRAEISTHELELRLVELHVIGCHLEHSEVEVCNWAKRAACYQHQWSL